jgi:hypothetical protein
MITVFLHFDIVLSTYRITGKYVAWGGLIRKKDGGLDRHIGLIDHHSATATTSGLVVVKLGFAIERTGGKGKVQGPSRLADTNPRYIMG